MRIAIIKIAILLIVGLGGAESLEIKNEVKLDFSVEPIRNFSRKINMFCALLDREQNPVNCDFNGSIDFEKQVLPLDIHKYYTKRGIEKYYTLLTKTVYSFDQDVSFFTRERLSDVAYLQKIMPYNKITRVEDDYELNVGFGAPDITFNLNFLTNDELTAKYPELVKYFRSYDEIDVDPSLVVFQHNHTFGRVLGQETSKMSMSITRYFHDGNRKTLAINYTLNFIHNLPPSILGGGNLLINQMKEGVAALVRDTRNVCEKDL